LEGFVDMTVKKVKNIFNTKTSEHHDVMYTYKVNRQNRNRANSYLSVALMSLFLAAVIVIIGYLVIDYDDSFMYSDKPIVNIILTPQDLPSN
jgi:hypothetical protein